MMQTILNFVLLLNSYTFLEQLFFYLSTYMIQHRNALLSFAVTLKSNAIISVSLLHEPMSICLRLLEIFWLLFRDLKFTIYKDCLDLLKLHCLPETFWE